MKDEPIDPLPHRPLRPLEHHLPAHLLSFSRLHRRYHRRYLLLGGLEWISTTDIRHNERRTIADTLICLVEHCVNGDSCLLYGFWHLQFGANGL